ncbi:hypothetical protein NKH77_47345 [Streptomyces sp. M19]
MIRDSDYVQAARVLGGRAPASSYGICCPTRCRRCWSWRPSGSAPPSSPGPR